MSVIDLSFGTNNITVYQYEPFWYRVSNPYYPLIPTLTQTGGIPSSTLKVDASGFTDFSSNTGLLVAPSSNEIFTLDVSSGLYRSSNNVVIGAGRFRDSNLAGLTGQTFNFYKNEPIRDVSLVLGFGTSNIYSVPALPPGLSITSNTSTAWKIAGTPTFQVSSNNYQFIATASGKTATSTVNIAVNPERIIVNLSGSPIVNNMQIGSTIPSHVFTTPYTYSPFTYTLGILPDGLVYKDSTLATISSSSFSPSDASRTLIVTGAPTSTAAQSFINAGITSKTVPIVASKSTIVSSNPLTFSFGETVLFSDASFQNIFYIGEALTPSNNSLSAATYFTSNVPITSIISTDLPSDLSTTFVYAQQRVYISGTPTSSIPLGTNTYTFRASNANAVTRDTTVNMTFSNDSVTVTKNVVDNCFNFILSRDLASNKTGYYPSPIRYQATVGSGRSVTFSATGLPSGVTLSNVSANVVQLTGTPTVVTSLQSLSVNATTTTNVSGTLDVNYAVVNDAFTFPIIQDASTTFFCGTPIEPIRFNVTTLSERPIVAYTTSNLPSGLYLSPSGFLTGTPALATTTEGTFTVTAYTGFATDTCSYNFSLIGNETLIETIKDSYPISTTQPFGPIEILAQSYTGSNLTASILGDVTPYQGTNSISVQLNNNQLTGDLTPVDYLFPRYNFQIQADNTSVNGRIDVANAPLPYHNALANDGSVRTSFTQTFSGTGNTYYIGHHDSVYVSNVPTWKLGEMLYYDGALSITDRESVQGYLAWKWGIQSNLPLSHPYRNFSPNPFSPTQISNCYLWLDANDAATITKGVSSNVISWNSRVSGLTAIFDVSNGAGGITPVAPVTDISTIGIKNAVYFSNTDARLQISNFSPTQQARTVFVVAEMVAKDPCDYNLPLLSRFQDFETSLELYTGNTYKTGIKPVNILGAGAITSEATDAVGTNPFSLTVINSDQLGSNYVAYNGNSISTFDSVLSGQARFYEINSFTSNAWSTVYISNVLDLAQTSSNLVAAQPTAVQLSTTSSTWAPASLDPSLNFTRVVTDGSAQIVVTGYLDSSGKTIVSSNNGTTWDVSDSTTVFNSIPVSTASLYNSNRYFIGQAGSYTPTLMLGSSNLNLAVSPDGLHWKSMKNYAYSGTETYTGAEKNGLWIIGGNDSNAPMKYSRDTINWTRIAFADFSSCTAVSYGDSVWVAGGGSVLAYSSNGIDWSNSLDASFTEVKALAAYGDNYIAGGIGGGVGIIKYSKDGINWSDISGSLPITNEVTGLAATSNMMVAVGRGGTTVAWSSNNGVEWNSTIGSSFLFVSNGNAVAYNGSRWVAVGEGGTSTIGSVDGKEWFDLGSNIPYPKTIAWTGDKWIAGGVASVTSNTYTSAVYSYDSINWYRMFETNYMQDSINAFVVGSSVSKPSLYYADSSNLSSWTATDLCMNVVYDLAQSNGTIVAVGTGTSNMAKSVDNGISWVPVTSGITGDITSISYANGVWMASGTSGSGNSKEAVLRYSSNLTTWATAYSNTTSTAATRDVLFDGNAWMTNIIGSYPASDSSSSATFLNLYHTAKKSDIGSNWLATSIDSNYLSYWYEKYLFSTKSMGSPSAVFSIPSSPGPLVFTSPTKTSYLFYQYVTITPIEIEATGIEEFGYFYALGLPRGLKLIPNPDGQTATIEGTPVEVFNEETTIYIFLRNGVYTIMTQITMKVIIPRIVQHQTSAGAYTSLVRQYTEVNAAQNAINSRVYPVQERALGEFMAPEAPDNLKEDPACKKC